MAEYDYLELGRGGRAAVWVALYIVCWLLMAWSCNIGLPSDCRRAAEPMEVLIELSVLTAFSLGQAVFCGILDGKRFDALATKVYFPFILVGSGLIISACIEIDELRDMRQPPGQEFTAYQVAVCVTLLMVILLAVLWHFAEAWRIFPGARMVSGQATNPALTSAESMETNPLRDYLLSRTLVVAYVMLYIAFAFEKGDGWGYHYILLAWALSLLSRFTSTASIAWLAITSAAFLQGIGAYSLRFLWSQEWSGLNAE